jgi:heme exporter protein D
MSAAQFFAMGGYAAFVWPAYGISFAALLGAVLWTLADWRRTRAELALLEAMKEEAK